MITQTINEFPQIAIFDIDNCIADDSRRVERISNIDYNNDEEMFDHYHQGMILDKMCNAEIIKEQSKDRLLVFLTARPEKYNHETRKWLKTNLLEHGINKDFHLIMRPEGDKRHSPELKPALLKENIEDLSRIKFICDDRKDVLEAYFRFFKKELKNESLNDGDIYICKMAIEERDMTGEFKLKDKKLTLKGELTFELNQPEEDSVKKVPEILEEMAKTFRERNKVYGSNYKMIGPMMEILFPDGVPKEVIFSDQFHLFELILVKLSRFAISGLKHEDSAKDAGVYCAMINAILLEKDDGTTI